MLTEIRNPVSIKPLEGCVLNRLLNSLRVEIWVAVRDPVRSVIGVYLGRVEIAVKENIGC